MIGLEPVVTGLIANALYDEITESAEENKREVVQRPRIVEDIGSTYLQTLETNLERTLGEDAEVNLEAVYQYLDERYDDVHKQLVMASDEEKIREALIEAILETLSPRVEEQQVDRAAVEDAVDYSLNTGFRAFVQCIDQAGLTEVVELELDMEILKRITKLSQGIKSRRRSQRNGHFMIKKDPDVVTEADSAALIGVPESSARFVQHPSLSDIEYDASRIVVGKKGAGKSRTLAHLVSEVSERITVDYLVILEDSFRVGDVNDLLSTGLDGTVLLVCDDVHRLEGPKEIHPFRRLISRLRTEMESGGRLISLCGIRPERLNSLPHFKRFNEDPVWGEFEKTRLESLGPASVKAILQSTLETIDKDASQSTIEALTQAVLAIDPTPLYTVTIAQQLDSGDIDIEADIEKLLPKNVATAWKDDYQVLLEESPTSANLLRTLKVFDRLHLPAVEDFVREIFQGAFDVSFIDFERGLSKLVQRHWVEYQELEHSGGVKNRLLTHQAQLESIPTVPKPMVVKLTGFLHDWEPTSFDMEDEERARIHTRIFNHARWHPEIEHTELEMHAREAIELAPDDPVVQSSVAVFYTELGRRDRASELFTDAADKKPHHPGLNYNCGNFLIKSRKPEQAKQYLQRAVDEEAENPVFLHSLGTALVGSGKVNEGLEHLQQARDRGSFTFGEIYFSIGDAHNIMGHHKQAVGNLNTAVDFFEETEKWLNLSNTYHLLTIAHFNHKAYEDCVEAAEKGYVLTERILEGELSDNPIKNDESLDPEQIQRNLVTLQAKALVQMK